MATKANLVIDQGTTFSVAIDLTDDNGDVIPLANSVATSQIRKWYSSVNAAATFTTAVDPNLGEIVLSLTANQTSNLVAGRYVYDVEIDTNGSVSRIVEGIITVTPQVTRIP